MARSNALLAQARPFLKWAGGKAQLLDQIAAYLPKELTQGKIRRYVEPFVGGGAVFFHIAQTYDIEEFVILDINEELIGAYTTVRDNVRDLVTLLADMESSYLAMGQEERKDHYYAVRSKFNSRAREVGSVERTAQLIFLNRTCYNGLFRVNAKGAFNVPFGTYKNPAFCFADNLHAVSGILQRADIRCGDFESSAGVVDKKTFVYFDPPYRPISRTALFNSYAKYDFDDSEQLRLAKFYRALDTKGAKLMLSNSDPKNEDPTDSFFDNAYQGFRIERLQASRMINRDAAKRGKICELLVMNY